MPHPLGSAVMRLPPELCLGVIQHVPDAPDLARLMLVSRFFKDVAEPLLYHSVTLESDEAVMKFSASLSLPGGRRNSLVHELRILGIGVIHPLILECVSHILKSLHSVRHLVFTVTQNPSLARGSAPYFDAILDAPLKLRSFQTNLHSFDLRRFMVSQPDIEDLRWFPRLVSFRNEDPIVGTAAARPVPLRILAYPAFDFTTVMARFSQGLTHLHLWMPYSSGLLNTMGSFCPRLVSLRLGQSVVYTANDPNPPLTIEDVAEKFPRLRFLQADVSNAMSGLNLQLVNWKAPPLSTRPRFSSSLTVAWFVTEGRQSMATSASDETRWYAIFDAAALDVLQNWGHYVPRIMYRYRQSPGMVLTLSQDGSRLNEAETELLTGEYWSCVAR